VNSKLSTTEYVRNCQRRRKAGWFYRRYDVSWCKRNLQAATWNDLPQIRAAWIAETNVKRPRKRLVAALRKTITDLGLRMREEIGRGPID